MLVLESAPTSPGMLPETGAYPADSKNKKAESTKQVDIPKISAPGLSTSAPELEGVWQEVKRRSKEKAKQKTPVQVKKKPSSQILMLDNGKWLECLVNK